MFGIENRDILIFGGGAAAVCLLLVGLSLLYDWLFDWVLDRFKERDDVNQDS